MVNNKSVTVPIAVIHSSPTLSQNTEKRDPKKILETPKVKKIPKIGTLLGTLVERTGVTSRLYTMYPEMKRLSKYFYSCSCSSVKQALLGSGTVRAKMYLSGCFFDWHPPTSSWHYLWESFSFCRLSLGWFNHINLNSFYSIFWIKFWIDISDWILNE